MCPKCGKTKYIDEYIEAPLNYGGILEFDYLCNKYGVDIAFNKTKDRIFKDRKKFLEVFCKNNIKNT